MFRNCLVKLVVISLCLGATELPAQGMNDIQTMPALLEGGDNPLTGKIWDVRNNRFIDRADLLHRLTAARYILLGETHDNSAHHAGQAWVINGLAGTLHDVDVVFEMIDDKQGNLMKQAGYRSSADLVTLLAQSNSGWEYSLYYQGLFDAVMKAGYTILPGNINRHELLSSIMHGQGHVEPAVQDLLTNTPFTHEQQLAMNKDIIESHCNMLNEKAAETMVRGQRIRDISMALNLFNAPQPVRVLIAGSGHVRNDYGVPVYLRQKDSGAKIIAIGFQGVEKGVTDIRQYAQSWETAVLPFDYLWLTERAQREDPCAGFKSRFNHEKQAQ